MNKASPKRPTWDTADFQWSDELDMDDLDFDIVDDPPEPVDSSTVSIMCTLSQASRLKTFVPLCYNKRRK